MKKYKLLCYVIYYLTGIFINKYNLWFNDSIKYKIRSESTINVTINDVEPLRNKLNLSINI